jgi:acyl carrier protein
MNDEILAQVREVAAELFGVSVGDLSATTSPADIETWDSVLNVNLVLSLEQRFGIEFDPEEIELMRSIGAFAEAVSRHVPSG